MEDIFIHYGASHFTPELIRPIRNVNFCKPRGGFWVSPIDTDWGWKDWCSENDFGRLDCSFKIKLHANARIYKINSYKDLEKLPIHKEAFGFQVLDFEAISKEYDALWLTKEGERLTKWFVMPLSLYGWDCESLCILNKEIIIPI